MPSSTTAANAKTKQEDTSSRVRKQTQIAQTDSCTRQPQLKRRKVEHIVEEKYPTEEKSPTVSDDVIQNLVNGLQTCGPVNELKIFRIGNIMNQPWSNIKMHLNTEGGFRLNEAKTMGESTEGKVHYYSCTISANDSRKILLVFGGTSDNTRNEVARLIRKFLVQTECGIEVFVRDVPSNRRTFQFMHESTFSLELDDATITIVVQKGSIVAQGDSKFEHEISCDILSRVTKMKSVMEQDAETAVHKVQQEMFLRGGFTYSVVKK
ncbi:MAG: hypothetical protein ACPGQS_10685 [Bradymonadia bacterium]